MTSLVTNTEDMEYNYPTEPVPKEEATCGPKSWKENKENFEEDPELSRLYEEGREGDIPEAFGKVSPISVLQKPLNSPVPFGSYPINIQTDINSRIERNTIKIPKIGPGKPIRLSFGNSEYMSTDFDPNDPEDIKYASGSNLTRSVAMALRENQCGICHQEYCAEQAGKEWYPIFNWKFLRKSCWISLCIRYHEYLEEIGLENTVLNFINFVQMDEIGIEV